MYLSLDKQGTFRSTASFLPEGHEVMIDNLLCRVQWFRTMHVSSKWIIPAHLHTGFEIHIVEDGICHVQLEHEEFNATKGIVYIMAPGVVHEQKDIDGQPYMEYCIHCELYPEKTPDSIGTKLFRLLDMKQFTLISDNSGIIDLFKEAIKQKEHDSFFGTELLTHLFVSILLSVGDSVAQVLGNQEIPARKEPVSREDDWFKRIRSYLNENITHPVTVGELSSHLYLSERHINRIVKGKTGMSTKSYISLQRLELIKVFLEKSQLSMKEISVQMGFPNEYSFYQFFKREEGNSPGAYRTKKHREENEMSDNNRLITDSDITSKKEV